MKQIERTQENSENSATSHQSPASARSRFFSLRYRFIIVTSLMLLVLLSVLAIVLSVLQARTIKNRIEKQGLAISHNLAAVSIDHLLTYNYVALEKLANQAANNPDIVHVVIHDKEGKIAGYSRRPDLQNTVLTDQVSRSAVNILAPRVSIRKPETRGKPVMDVAVPVFLPDSRDRWGTVRATLSLELMYQQIKQTRWSIFVMGIIALVFGIFIANWAALRITKPLDTLVTATIEAASGKLEQNIDIRTRDEVEILAANFSYMIREILNQKQQLETHLYEIRQLQQYAEEILSTMHDGLLVVDMKGVVSAANPAAHSILNLKPERQTIGMPAKKLFGETSPLTGYIQQSLENPSGRHQHELCLQSKGEKTTLLVGRGILKNETQTHRQIIFTLSDITALKQLEAEIRQNQRLADLGTMAAGMAHEIRNPLSAIKTYVSLLPKKIERPGFLEKFQRTVPREINRLNTLIEELLELSRPPKYNFQNTDIGTLLIRRMELMEADFTSRDIFFQTDLPQHIPRVMADADQIEKVFINLLQNGAQAMPGGGSIFISVSCKTDGLVIKIRDQGHGFSQETAEDIFNPFFTTKAKGTGLGLAITHKIITEHGGQIEVESQKKKGSCFIVFLPISSL